MIIFGFRTSVRQIALLTFACRVCGTVAAQHLLRRTTKFSLFFIPLFPVRVRHQAQCAVCGGSYDVSAAEARRLGA